MNSTTTITPTTPTTSLPVVAPASPVSDAPEVCPAPSLAPPTPVRQAGPRAVTPSQVQDEAYWTPFMEPLVMQMTHRKNDYGTILSFLKSVNVSTSPLLVSMREAEKIPREAGRWFIVTAEERAVVRLGIGTNPGLKKYYWRANGSKRLLKREMQDDDEADLVYIIQKANTVSKRCIALPEMDFWLIMYLPSTMRTSKASAAAAAAAASTSSSSLDEPAERAVDVDEEGMRSPMTSPGPSARKRKLSVESSSSDDNEQRAAGVAGPSGSPRGPAGPRVVKKVVRKLSQKRGGATPCEATEGEDSQVAAPSAAAMMDASRGGKRQRRGAYEFSYNSSSVQAPEDDDDEEDEYVEVVDIDDDDEPLLAPASPAGPSQLDPPSDEDVFFSFYDGEQFANYAAPPPTTSKLEEPDPFLPLAGSQTGFSAAIEAACMSGSSNYGLPQMDAPFRIQPAAIALFDGFEPIFV